jgi:hypothetical protein
VHVLATCIILFQRQDETVRPMLCRQFFTAQHANLAPVLEKLGGGLAQSCTLEKFTVAAAVVRARLLPAFPMDSPALIPGLQSVHYALLYCV